MQKTHLVTQPQRLLANFTAEGASCFVMGSLCVPPLSDFIRPEMRRLGERCFNSEKTVVFADTLAAAGRS